ncbi:MAG: DUF3784 domain-containing protein [Clostridia bacterium]|nr:DUF3784 domain-containing protein [Clostridia bacterium]
MDILFLIILIFILVVSLILGLKCLMGKNIILDDTYIKAPKEEKEKMDIKAYRTQSAVTFLLVFVMTLFNLLRGLTHIVWFSYIAAGVSVFAIVYFIVSHFVLKKKSKH